MLCVPADSVEILKVAAPPFKVAVPKPFAPSRNATVPVAAGGVTVAVNVTVCPAVEGLGVPDRTVFVLTLLTDTATDFEVLAPYWRRRCRKR